MKRALITLICLTLAPACGGDKKGGGGEQAGGEKAGGGEAEVEGAEMHDNKVELKFNSGSRKMYFEVSGKMPKWPLDEKNSREGNKLYRKDLKDFFGSPSFAISATCHGSCQAEKLQENLDKFQKGKVDSAKKYGKVLKDGAKIRDGVWGFALETGGDKNKKVEYGITFIPDPTSDFLLFCTGSVPSDMFEGIWNTCLNLKVVVVDVMLPPDVLKKEEANLAKCPKASSFKLAAAEGQQLQEGMQPMEGTAKATLAYSSNVGYASASLANFDMKTARFNKNPLTEGQQVIDITLHADKGKELISGKYPLKRVGDAAHGALRIKAGKTTWSLSSPEGEIEVIARTKTKICGKFTGKDKWRVMSGEFSADLAPKMQ